MNALVPERLAVEYVGLLSITKATIKVVISLEYIIVLQNVLIVMDLMPQTHLDVF